MTGEVRWVPNHLVPIEAEREVVSGALRAAMVLQEHPQHRAARAAMNVITGIDPAIFADKSIGIIVAAIQTVYVEAGSVTFSAVLAKLHHRREPQDVFRCLDATYDYGLAPIVGMAKTVEQVRAAASGRKAYNDSLDTAARIYQGDTP